MPSSINNSEIIITVNQNLDGTRPSTTGKQCFYLGGLD